MNKWNAFKIDRLYTTRGVYAYTNYKQVLESTWCTEHLLFISSTMVYTYS